MSSEEVRKSVGTTKNVAGFLNSVKQRKGKKPDEIPLLEMDSTDSDSKSSIADGSLNSSLKSLRENSEKVQVAEISGRTFRFWIPTEYKTKNIVTDPPRERIQLNWVYGYRGHDCRNNIHLLASGELIYFIGHVAVLYNRDQHFQRHYREHTDDIKCISVHSNGTTIATGQQSTKTGHDGTSNAHIRIWRADNLQTVHVLGMGKFHTAVSCLGFARTKDRVIAVDNGDDHVMTVWNTASGKELARTALEAETICSAEFNPKNPDIIVTIGKEHIVWWKLYPDNNAIEMHMKADYGKHLRAKFITCLMHNDRGDLVTGDSNGTIYIWPFGGNTIGNLVKHAHDGPVFCMALVRGVLLSGGRDSAIHAWTWNRNMDPQGSLTINTAEGGVRMLMHQKDTLIIGTTMNTILHAELSTEGLPLQGVSLDPIPLTQGHYDDLRSMVAVECGMPGIFCSAGSDGIISLFDSISRQCVWKSCTKNLRITSCDVSESATLVVLGLKDGGVVFFKRSDTDTHEICRLKCGKDRLTNLKLSPDCQKVAVGSQIGHVYLLSYSDQSEQLWKQDGICKGEGSPITGLDWSSEVINGDYLIRTSTYAPGYYLWNATNCCKICETEGLRDITWATETCKLSYHVLGMWSSNRARESSINAIAVNNKKTMLAMGDSQGYITMFRYPCSKNGAFCHTYKSHSQVTNMLFTKDGQYLITCGGKDTLIMQWRIV